MERTNPLKLPEHVSKSVERLNPHLFGVGVIPNPKRQPDERRESQNCQLEDRPRSLGFRITIISIRSRLGDIHDNIRTGAKPLVDAITASLGFRDDSNPGLYWEYYQIVGKPRGTIVLIERL